MLTALAAVLPPRVAHRLAGWLRLDAAVAMFCPCCPEWAAWAPEEAAA